MITVKLSAQDLRVIRGAQTEQELLGARQLMLDRVAQSEVLREFGKTPKVRPTDFRWKEALEVAREVLGDNVTFPKITDYAWYRRVNGAIMHDDLGADYVRGLAEFVRDNMRMPIKFDFLICQHKRILAGEFRQQRQVMTAQTGEPTSAAGRAVSFGPELPEE